MVQVNGALEPTVSLFLAEFPPDDFDRFINDCFDGATVFMLENLAGTFDFGEVRAGETTATTCFD
jgi:hypothetical protein